MKVPSHPTKPYAPYKPLPPLKEMEIKTNLGTLSSQEDCTYSLQSIRDHVTENYPNVDPETVRFTMEINTTHGYYDEVSTSLDIDFYTVAMGENPAYAKQYKYYEEQLKKYEAESAKYKLDSKQYKLDLKQYQKDIDAYQLWYSQETIKRLTQKKNEKSKKK